MADFWSKLYDAIKASAKEIEKGVSSVGTAISNSPVAQQTIASSVADTQQASATAAAQAQAAADQKKVLETTKSNSINAANDAMIKQASAGAKGLSSNILTGAQGVDKSKEKTSAVVLGGSDSSGNQNLGGLAPQQMQGRIKKTLGR